MKKNSLLIYTTVSLGLLIPLAGRLAYGIIAILLLNLLTMVSSMVNGIVKKNDMGPYGSALNCISLVGVTLIFKQLLTLYSPILSLTMGFNLYLIAASSLLAGFINSSAHQNFVRQFHDNMKFVGRFSILVLIFFLVRDIVAYGTITLPARTGLFVVRLFPLTEYTMIGSFFGTIPGALILVAIVIILFSFIGRKFDVVRVMKTHENKAEKSVQEKVPSSQENAVSANSASSAEATTSANSASSSAENVASTNTVASSTEHAPSTIDSVTSAAENTSSETAAATTQSTSFDSQVERHVPDSSEENNSAAFQSGTSAQQNFSSTMQTGESLGAQNNSSTSSNAAFYSPQNFSSPNQSTAPSVENNSSANTGNTFAGQNEVKEENHNA